MHVGISLFATDLTTDIRDVARAAEDAGFESLFVAEHSHIPTSRKTPHPSGEEMPIEYAHTLDPFVSMSMAAAVTEHLKIGTSICLVNERDPISLAKEVASLDLLSGGRLVFGVGAGWNVEEMTHHGIDPDRRWDILRDRVKLMQALWTDEVSSYDGEFVSLEPSWQWPKPVQHPIPVLIGGGGKRPMRHAVEYGTGWMPMPSKEKFGERLSALTEIADEAGRPVPTVTLTAVRPDRGVLDHYAEMGIERAVLILPFGPDVLPTIAEWSETGRRVTRALVLGGGGVAGIAWETGLLLGLLDLGIDVTDADIVIGTSAGSAVAAQITTGTSLAGLYERQVSGEAARSEIKADFDADSMMATFGKIVAKLVPGVVMNRAIGEYALHAPTVPEAKRRAVIAARLPVHDWPDANLVITSVDARSGKPRNFTRDDGVELVDAVAASCAVPGIWPPVTIGKRRYIDGGMRSTSNADLATGYHDVLVISPMPELPMVGASVKKAIQRLAEKSCVVTIQADADSLAAMGSNPLDPATAKPAAEAGRAQAAAHLAEVEALWKGNPDG